MEQFQKLQNQNQKEQYQISPQGLHEIQKFYNSNDPQKYLLWTTNHKIELPIRIQKQKTLIPPITIIEEFELRVKKTPQNPALSQKVNGKWISINFKNFYDQCRYFGQALISLNINKHSSVNIIGYNSIEWAISFFGSIFGFYLPVGIYTSNNPETCKYIAQNSKCEILVVQNNLQLNKYIIIWDTLPNLKYIIIYNDIIPENLPNKFKNKVLLWDNIIEIGKNFKPQFHEDIQNRMKEPKPGHCCTLVYTSGTTGNPKGVMLSHDNYIWTSKCSLLQMFKYKKYYDSQDRALSFLPLSHVAAQLHDLIDIITGGIHVFFADQTALKSSLVEFLKEVRPTLFWAVPRFFEKIEQKMKDFESNQGYIKQKCLKWGIKYSKQYLFNDLNQKPQQLNHLIANKLISVDFKREVGLDQAHSIFFGAAPLNIKTRNYFLERNIFLFNGYGMSEFSGPITRTNPLKYQLFDENFLKSTGQPLDGIELKIYNPNDSGNGEICCKGRNRFMGYFQNDQATRQAIDQEGFLHTGDVGSLDSQGNLTITGRIKELIITSGGENIAPILIEDIIKDELKIISNALVVGDQKNHLSVLLFLKQDIDANNQLINNQLAPDTLLFFQQNGIKSLTIQEAKSDIKLRSLIDQSLDRVNKRVVSKASQVTKWVIMDKDLSIEAGDFTPTQKLKRNVVTQKFQQLIDSLYIDSKL